MTFSRMSLGAIEGFAGQLGLPLRPARDGSVSFVFAETGTLSLTPSRDGARVLVSLARRPAWLGPELLQAALAGAGVDPGTGRIVYAGLAADDSLVFSLSLDEAECDLPTLDACLHQLAAVHRGLP
ncbi:CesT family type III secretion system chaperone [uncultured Methylobacterium sp.]|uniref:CesT family type III secretion system chaperone n=1 Tax=uncultured Methylobacterium sp. TaxID=157278 RepID=UPI0035CC0C94